MDKPSATRLKLLSRRWTIEQPRVGCNDSFENRPRQRSGVDFSAGAAGVARVAARSSAECGPSSGCASRLDRSELVGTVKGVNGLAEAVGFEPTVGSHLRWFSRPVP